MILRRIVAVLMRPETQGVLWTAVVGYASARLTEQANRHEKHIAEKLKYLGELDGEVAKRREELQHLTAAVQMTPPSTCASNTPGELCNCSTSTWSTAPHPLVQPAPDAPEG